MSEDHDGPFEYARGILRDLHRAGIVSETKHNSAEHADEFVRLARGLEDLQTPECVFALWRYFAIREGKQSHERAIRLLQNEGVAVLAKYARNGASGFKPLHLFTLNETENTKNFYVQTATQYEIRAGLWQAAAAKHAEHPKLPLGDVLDVTELSALADTSLEAEAV